MKLVKALLLSSLALCGFAACGSSDSGSSGGTNYTLDNVCTLLPAKICAARAGCCTASGIGYVETNCEDYEKGECQKNVDEVNAGTMTFNPSRIDSCLTQVKPVFDACRVGITELQQYLPALDECRQIFVGKLDIGATCDRDAQCKPSGDANKPVSCSDSTKKCVALAFVGSGASCSFDPNALALCQSGLYCDLTSANPPSGSCKPAVAKGQTCDPLKAECGLGFYCDPTSKSCVDGKNEGETCATALECKSVTCTSLKCAPPDPVVHSDECT